MTRKKEAEKSERQTGGTVKRRIRLKNASDVARYMSRCIRSVEQVGGEAEANLSYKKVSMAVMLLKAIEVSSLEERIKDLEQRTGEK